MKKYAFFLLLVLSGCVADDADWYNRQPARYADGYADQYGQPWQTAGGEAAQAQYAYSDAPGYVDPYGRPLQPAQTPAARQPSPQAVYYAPQPTFWPNSELYYEQQPDGWDYALAPTYVQHAAAGYQAPQYQPVFVAQPVAQPAYEQTPVILQHPETRRLVRCALTDSNCIGSHEKQGYMQLSAAPYFAGAQEVESPSDYPDAYWRDTNNIPRW